MAWSTAAHSWTAGEVATADLLNQEMHDRWQYAVRSPNAFGPTMDRGSFTATTTAKYVDYAATFSTYVRPIMSFCHWGGLTISMSACTNTGFVCTATAAGGTVDWMAYGYYSTEGYSS